MKLHNPIRFVANISLRFDAGVFVNREALKFTDVDGSLMDI